MININYFRYHDDCVAFFQQLVQTPSVNDRDQEDNVVQVIKEEAIKLGLPYCIFKKEVKRPNIFVGEDFFL